MNRNHDHIDRIRNNLVLETVKPGDHVLFVATMPYAARDDFFFRGGTVLSINRETGACSIRGEFFTMDNVPARYILGLYDSTVHEKHYGFANVRPIGDEDMETANRYLYEVACA